MKPIHPATVRYIKLGRGGRWEDASLDNGEIHFGFSRVPHEVAQTGDRERIKQFVLEQGIRSSRQAAQDDAREIGDFYTLGADCLWITFARQRLWWTFAEPEVFWNGSETAEQGTRKRKTLDGWHDTDIRENALRVAYLSTRLTQTASYRRTICTVTAEDYLLRRINGQEEPIVTKAKEVRETFLQVITEAVRLLHFSDFETLVDLIFARSGWHRVSALGETQATIDLELEQPTTGEIAFVQVKSRASQSVLNDYLERFHKGIWNRMFFICHSPVGRLACGRSNVHVWADQTLAQAVLRHGLQDWVLAKVA